MTSQSRPACLGRGEEGLPLTRALIVNADDYALSVEVSVGICEAYRSGVVTDASALVFSPSAPAAFALAREAGLPLGLHLDLVTAFVGGRSPCLGPQGRCCTELFAREFGSQPGPGLSCEDLIIIRDEIRRQVDRFVQLAGRLPSHLDYHFGLHYLPEVMAIYLIVAEEYALPVRWAAQYAGHTSYNLAPDCLRDGFTGRGDVTVEDFLTLLDQPWEGVLEVVCHPGYVTPGELQDAYNEGRERELRVLTDPRLIEALEARAITRVNFDWLKCTYGELAPYRGREHSQE